MNKCSVSGAMRKEPVALAVNAVGQSRRMGRVKALLPVSPSGERAVAVQWVSDGRGV